MEGPESVVPDPYLVAMENSNRELTAIETLFLDAGLPAVEVQACPVPGCELCAAALPKAA